MFRSADYTIDKAKNEGWVFFTEENATEDISKKVRELPSNVTTESLTIDSIGYVAIGSLNFPLNGTPLFFKMPVLVW